MKIAGHPLHVMLIHFPAALFPMDLVCSLAHYFGGPSALLHAAVYATLGGVGFGWLAVLSGSIDLVPVIKHKPALISKSLIHGGLNTLVVVGFSVFAANYLKVLPMVYANSVIGLTLKACLVFIMIVGNFIGGSLVLKDGVGSQQ